MYFKNKIYRDDAYCLNIKDAVRSELDVNKNKSIIINTNGLTLKNAFTFEFRLKLDIRSGSFPFLFSILKQGDTSGFRVYWNNSSNIRITWLDATVTSRDVTRAATLGNMLHVVVVFELGVRVSLYINGVKTENTTNATINGTFLNSINLLKGTDVNNHNYFGKIIGFRLFDEYAASDAQVTALYSNILNRMIEVPAAMQSYLKREHIFGQKNGRKVIDSSGSEHFAMLQNGFSDTDILQNGNAWQPI
jgi:hypothetical protein